MWTSPCEVVDAVGDVIDLVAGEHLAGDFTVNFGDATSVVAEVHGEFSHREGLFAGDFFDVPGNHVAEEAMGSVVIENIVAGFYWRVGGESTVGADSLVFVVAFAEEFESEERCVSFVHMESANFVISESSEHPNTANAEDGFLFNAHCLVTAVEVIGDFSVVVGVFFEVGVEEKDRHNVAVLANEVIFPNANVNIASFNLDSNFSVEFF